MADDRGTLLQRHLLLVKALCDSRPSKGDCQVLAVISGHVDSDGEAWPGVNRIAAKAGIHRSTVLRSVERLEAWGYVEVARERGRSNLYRIASTSSASATGLPWGLVAPTHSTSSTAATSPVAPARPDQSHPRDPNSASYLSSSNSKNNSVACGASSDQQEQDAKKQQEAAKREGLVTEYRQALKERPEHAYFMRRTWPWLEEAA
jgi:hypothetical protein